MTRHRGMPPLVYSPYCGKFEKETSPSLMGLAKELEDLCDLVIKRKGERIPK